MVYRLAGLRIVSDLPLPGLASCQDRSSAVDEIVIRRAHVPKSLSPVGILNPDVQSNGDELLLNIPGVACYLLRGGNEILVDQAPGSGHGDVCAFLLGTVFGALCHQRGITPLHGSAVDVTDGCVAFVGETGAGKSTLAATLAARGHQVIADDVCFLRIIATGDVQAWPGISRIRLWEDAVAALGCDGPGVERELRGYNKYLVPVRPPRNRSEPRRLRRVYQLQTKDGAPSVSRLRGAAAIEVLMQNTYRLGLAERLGCKPAVFDICAAMARDIPVFQFSRPMAFETLSEGVKVLEDHLQDIQ